MILDLEFILAELAALGDYDRDREGIPETNWTCTIDGEHLPKRQAALERMIELGYVKRGHPWIDITAEGDARIKERVKK